MRALELVLAVRRKQRDATAGMTAIAESRLVDAEADEAQATQAVEVVLAEGTGSVDLAALERRDREREIARANQRVAEAARRQEAGAVEKARGELRVRERAVRVSEKIVARAVEERGDREARSEQLMFDDITASGRRRI
jgi:hypothetical protein